MKAKKLEKMTKDEVDAIHKAAKLAAQNLRFIRKAEVYVYQLESIVMDLEEIVEEAESHVENPQ